MLLNFKKLNCAIFLLLGSMISWANDHCVSFSQAEIIPKRKQPLQYIFFNWATIFPRKQNKSCGRQYLPQDSKYFFYWATIYPRRKQIYILFWATTFPREANSGEKPAENWKLPSVTSTLRPVVNSNRTCEQSPYKFKLRAKSTQFE